MTPRSRRLAGLLLLTAGAALVSHQHMDRPVPAAPDLLLRHQLTSGKTPGVQYRFVGPDSVLVRHDGGLADVRRRIPVSARTTYNGFSVTKTVTAVAVLQLAERGAVELDRPASDYVPGFPYPGDITVRQLLTHSAGIPNPLPMRWIHLEREHETFDGAAFFRARFDEHPRVKARPNERFAYSNLGYVLLGTLIENVTGVRYEQYVMENVLTPIGAGPAELGFVRDRATHAKGYQKRLSFGYVAMGFLIDRAKYFGENEESWRAFEPYYVNGAAYGGLVGTADGFARYAQALLASPSPLLSEESKQLMFSENLLNGGRPSGMALSWFKGELEGHTYYAHAGGGGGYYAEVRLYPNLNRASVIMFNRSGLSDERFLDRVDRDLIRAEGEPAFAAVP